jgi:hypothetical protein
MRHITKNISLLLITVLFIGCGGSGKSNDNTNVKDEIKVNGDKTSDPVKTTKPTVSTANDKEDNRVFYISKKIEYYKDENITTTYTYKDKHLDELKKSSTMGTSNFKKYRYFQNHKVVKAYDSNDLVVSVAVFEELKNPSKRFTYDNRLSLNTKINFITLPYDSLKVLDKEHISKLIYPNTTGNIYKYDKEDNLLSRENGYFDDNGSGILSQIDDKNTNFLLNDNLKFIPEQVSNYEYDSTSVLKSVTFKASSEFKADVNVSFYGNGLLKDMNISTGDRYHYDENGLLAQNTRVKNGMKSTINYTYSKDLKTITVKDADGRLVKEYRFDIKEGE